MQIHELNSFSGTPGSSDYLVTDNGTDTSKISATDLIAPAVDAVATETTTRQSADNLLQAQIDQFVAPSGTAPNPTEIENARVGADGVTYTTLGEAIRTQVSDLKSDISNICTWDIVKPRFISGVYQWDKINSKMLWSFNSSRATADLRFLGLEQGDSIGITDYTTYSIAFGDNGSWYDGGYATTDVTANNPNILPYIVLVKRNDNATMTDSDFEALTSQFHSTKTVTELDVNKKFETAVDTRRNYVHLSFDDVSYCIINLAKPFATIWDEPFFKMLKRLHDTYGAVFSLYVWDIANLANIPTHLKQDFIDASQWLKLGYHSTAEDSLENASAAEAKQDYDTFINSVFSKCGGVNSVDRIPRLNYFKGNLNALRALRDCDCGCIGFLNADDDRKAYYLTDDELTYLRTHSLWSDRTNGLQFISTVMRLDWFVPGFSSNYNYNTPVKSTPYEELVYRYGQPAMADLYANLIVFTHEWQTYSSSYVLNSAMVDRLEQVCQFANDYNYDFDFPQNRVPNITSISAEEPTINNFATTVKGQWSFKAVEDSGNIVSSTTRIACDPFKASKVVVSFPTGYKVNVCRYNSAVANSASYVGRTNWQTSKQTITGDYYYVIVASTTSDTATLDIADNYTITAIRNINDI